MSALRPGLVAFCAGVRVKAGGSMTLNSTGGRQVQSGRWKAVPVCWGCCSSLQPRANAGAALKDVSFSTASQVQNCQSPPGSDLGTSRREDRGPAGFSWKSLVETGAGPVNEANLSCICDVKSHILVTASP